MESTIATKNLEKSSNDNTLSKEKGWMEEVLAPKASSIQILKTNLLESKES
jgi:hypothetical protein